MTVIDTNLIKASRLMSSQTGILAYYSRMPHMNGDPHLYNFGVFPSKTLELGGEDFQGRSSGCGWDWTEGMLGTIGETVERYCPAFYDMSESIFCSYKELNKPAVHPSEFALFHDKQYDDERIFISRFTEDLKVHWFPTTDLITGEEVWCPGIFLYMPFSKDPDWLTANTSTGLAAHTDPSKALLTALHEVIERDSFTITWSQKIVPPKLKITPQIADHLNEHFPVSYEWNFFDITYDLGIPTVFGICFGEAEYGPFVAVGTSTRPTMGEALQKTIKEIAQAVGYFRYLLGERKDWDPPEDPFELQDFEVHSIYYLKRPELWHVFDKYRNAPQEVVVDLNETSSLTDEEQIHKLLSVFQEKGYNVLFKDLTTPDVSELGFYSIKVFIPQLIQMSGVYPLYFHGGKRLYEVPKLMGYPSHDYDNLNIYPHPFP